MPNIKKKSEECLDAAQVLINGGLFNSSVHCSYYSVFLHMKYILANTDDRPISYITQKEKGDKESHKYVFREITNRAINSSTMKDIKQLYDYIKSKRIDADYTDKLFEDTDSLDIIDKSKGLHQKLNDQFGKL